MVYSPPSSSKLAAPINTKADRLGLPVGAARRASGTPTVATTNGAIATVVAAVGWPVGAKVDGAAVFTRMGVGVVWPTGVAVLRLCSGGVAVLGVTVLPKVSVAIG